MLEPSTASQTARSEDADDSTSNRPSKKRGNLSATLDRELEARLPPGQPGRPKGTTNALPGQHVLHYLAVNVGQAEVAALVFVGQLQVVYAKAA